MTEYDPSTGTVDEVLKKLDKASGTERQRILAAEQSGKRRSTILDAHGVDPEQRTDASGRVLYPWEVSPEDAATPDVASEAAQPAAAPREQRPAADATTPPTN